MKVAISSKGPHLDADVDPRFGRGAYILIIDTETGEYQSLDNSSNVNAFKGAGIQTATMVCDQGVELVMTGYCGPKAFAVLEKAKVKVVADATGTVADCVQRCKSGDLTFVTSANAEAHW